MPVNGNARNFHLGDRAKGAGPPEVEAVFRHFFTDFECRNDQNVENFAQFVS